MSLDQIPSARAVQAGERLERFLYRQSAAVTTVTEPFMAHIDAICHRDPPASLVLNGTLDMFFEIEPDLSARAELGVPDDRFLVMFAGTLGIAQALPSVIEAAKLCEPGVEFVFVGDGPVREQLERKAMQLGVENVHFHPQVPLGDVPRLLAAANALLVTLSAHPTFEDFVPSKLVDFMASGRPVILAAAGESVRLIADSDGGLAVPPQDPQALADAVRRLIDDPARAMQMARNAREYVRPRLRSAQAERLERVLVELVDGPAA